MINIYAASFNMLQVRTYILVADDSQCVIIDPGCQSEVESQKLEDFVAQRGYKPVAIWLTHLHLDHVYGVARAVRHWNVPVVAGQNDQYLLPEIESMAREWDIPAPQPFSVSQWLTDGQTLKLGSYEVKAIEVPGHTRGSIVYYCPAANACFSGDVLFRHSFGRTDLLGGDPLALMMNLQELFAELPPETDVFPGHGPKTTIGEEENFLSMPN